MLVLSRIATGFRIFALSRHRSIANCLRCVQRKLRKVGKIPDYLGRMVNLFTLK
jgi:hypothetical protein